VRFCVAKICLKFEGFVPKVNDKRERHKHKRFFRTLSIQPDFSEYRWGKAERKFTESALLSTEQEFHDEAFLKLSQTKKLRKLTKAHKPETGSVNFLRSFKGQILLNGNKLNFRAYAPFLLSVDTKNVSPTVSHIDNCIKII
jgi:hypothetical protein